MFITKSLIQLLIAANICAALATALPRDNYAEGNQENIAIHQEDLHVIPLEKSQYQPELRNAGITFQRVPCPVEGPVDYDNCISYCGGKGYQNGVCINYVCNCV